jgi:predicted RNA binding protein YcfA (HicA-like mRNA interferase family)
MPNPRKVLLKAYNNPKGLRFTEFISLVEAFGFEFRRQVSSHRVHARSDVREIVNAQPAKDGKAKDVQVKDFLALIEQYDLRLEDDPR